MHPQNRQHLSVEGVSFAKERNSAKRVQVDRRFGGGNRESRMTLRGVQHFHNEVVIV